jgi:hypothetical protein
MIFDGPDWRKQAVMFFGAFLLGGAWGAALVYIVTQYAPLCQEKGRKFVCASHPIRRDQNEIGSVARSPEQSRLIGRSAAP